MLEPHNRISPFLNDLAAGPSGATADPQGSRALSDAQCPLPNACDEVALLADYLAADVGLATLAANHLLTLNQLLDWLESPNTQSLLAALTRAAQARAQLIAAQAHAIALTTLTRLAADTDNELLPPRLAAMRRETARKAAAQLLRLNPAASVSPRSPSPPSSPPPPPSPPRGEGRGEGSLFSPSSQSPGPWSPVAGPSLPSPHENRSPQSEPDERLGAQPAQQAPLDHTQAPQARREQEAPPGPPPRVPPPRAVAAPCPPRPPRALVDAAAERAPRRYAGP